MNKKEKIEFWIDIADYDIKTAKVMLKSRRYLYVVFMCQQALEKIIKALYINTFDEEPPRSHNLAFIFKKLSIKITTEKLDLLNKLSAFYITNRYPEYKQMLSTLLDRKQTKEYFTKTEEVYEWLKSLLP